MPFLALQIRPDFLIFRYGLCIFSPDETWFRAISSLNDWTFLGTNEVQGLIKFCHDCWKGMLSTVSNSIPNLYNHHIGLLQAEFRTRHIKVFHLPPHSRLLKMVTFSIQAPHSLVIRFHFSYITKIVLGLFGSWSCTDSIILAVLHGSNFATVLILVVPAIRIFLESFNTKMSSDVSNITTWFCYICI